MSNNSKFKKISNKKRKHIDHNSNITSPPKKRAKISKRSSKRPTIPTTSPNSHITITFANIYNTIDAITLPKDNVLFITNDVLLENKHKLSIKKSDPIQHDIAPEIPIDIQTLNTPNIKTIHSKNLFRMGTSLFYCSDAQRLFWAFPLRKTRRVACQHHCVAVNKIVTRTIGIHSNACNGNHPKNTSCVYAICNGKPSKTSIPSHLLANYQYFQHAANISLLVLKDPIPQLNINKNVSNINKGPPPLIPIKNENVSVKRAQFMDSGEPIPFQENVQIDLKALKQKAKMSSLCISSSVDTDGDAHDYKRLLYSNSSESEIEQTPKKSQLSNSKKCKTLLLNGRFDDAISLLKVEIDREVDKDKLNEYRLLIAIALYCGEDTTLALHFCELLLTNCSNNIQCYEARKLRGLINKDLHNYKAACYDFEFICHNNPYGEIWTDKLYAKKPNTYYINKDIIKQPIVQTMKQESNYNIWQNNNNYYQHQPLTPLPPDLTLDLKTLNVLGGNMTIPTQIMKINTQRMNGNGVFVPTFMDRQRNRKSNGININGMLDINYSNLTKGLNEQGISIGSFGMLSPCGRMARKTTREELLDEHSMMIERCMSLNSINEENNDLSTNMTCLNRTVSTTPKPLDKMRSDALMN